MRHLCFFILLWGIQSNSTAQVVNIEEQRITGTTDSVHWYGHVRGSASLAKVKQQSLLIQSQAKVQFKSDPHLGLLLLNLNLLRAGNNDFSRQAFAHLRYNYKISKIWTWEAFTQIQTSPIQLLEKRELLGTGLRLRLLKSSNGRQRIYLGTAWLWEQNRFSEPFGISAKHRSSNYLSSTFRLGAHTLLIQTSYWQPVWNDIRNYRLSTEWLLKISVGKHLAFSVEFDYGIDKNLPLGAAAETFAWRNGISWQF